MIRTDGGRQDIMENGKDIRVTGARHICTILPSDGVAEGFDVIQGGCTDGRYIYQCNENQMNDYSHSEFHRTRIVKIDPETGERTAVSEPYPLDHSNDMCWNSLTSELMVVYNGRNAKRITVFDRDSLRPVRSFEISRNIFALAHDPEHDRYAAGVSGGMDVCVYDRDFNETAYLPLGNYGHVTQGIDCDSRYIYAVQTGRGNIDGDRLYGYLLVFDWEGTPVAHTRIPLPDGETSEKETENISHIGGRFFVGYHARGKGCLHEIFVEGL